MGHGKGSGSRGNQRILPERGFRLEMGRESLRGELIRIILVSEHRALGGFQYGGDRGLEFRRNRIIIAVGNRNEPGSSSSSSSSSGKRMREILKGRGILLLMERYRRSRALICIGKE